MNQHQQQQALRTAGFFLIGTALPAGLAIQGTSARHNGGLVVASLLIIIGIWMMIRANKIGQ